MSDTIMQHSPSPPSSCLPQYKCQHPLPNTPSISFGNDTKLTVKDTTATELLFWLRTCLRKALWLCALSLRRRILKTKTRYL